MHTGDVQLRDEGNYIGTTINKAARLRDLAHGGQTVLSGAAAELAADSLPPDAWITELGTHRMRDLPRAERVVQLCHPDVGVEFPPLRVVEDAAAGRLPVHLTNFIGRRDEIAETAKHFGGQPAADADRNRRGREDPAGAAARNDNGRRVRRRRLVRRSGANPASRRDRGDYRTRRWACPISPAAPRSTMSCCFIGERAMLLVVDNCEHLLDGIAAVITELLARCPNLKALATSREPIGSPAK